MLFYLFAHRENSKQGIKKCNFHTDRIVDVLKIGFIFIELVVLYM